VYDPAFLPTADTQAADALSWLTNSANSFRRVHSYVTLSPGPDKSRERIGYKCFPWKSTLATEQAVYLDYDPSNGTLSKGDIYRFGGSFTTGDWDRTVAGRGPQGPEAN